MPWGDHCPDEHLAAYCAMRTQMDADVPIDDLDIEPTVFDEDRVRTSEERLARSYDQLHVAARRRSDGVFGGFSIVLLPKGEPHALQFDTLVMPEHRGHRLGLADEAVDPRPGAGRASRPHRLPHLVGACPTRRCRRPTGASATAAVERMHDMQRRLG